MFCPVMEVFCKYDIMVSNSGDQGDFLAFSNQPGRTDAYGYGDLGGVMCDA